MSDFLRENNAFLNNVVATIEENLSDEAFGVTELADRMAMSRSNLLRKVKKHTGVSVSVYIRKVRLHRAKNLLKDPSLNISEISFQVGFSSTSYFTKCFREEYGYTPGEANKVAHQTDTTPKESSTIATSTPPTPFTTDNANPSKNRKLYAAMVLVSLSIALFFWMTDDGVGTEMVLDKSIAVLPFKNDSNDSSNVYIINGLMEAILDNLQKVEALEVTSRTSVEKFRNANKTIPELSDALGVHYFVEGSGQKVGNKILLTIQLIEAKTDKHLWSEQYEREAEDIFALQMEVAQKIAKEVQAVITPEEQKRIEKVPTENLVAYDYYLKGMEQSQKETHEGLNNAIVLYDSAIQEDPKFAHAYALTAICYYYLDIFKKDKRYSSEINTYADKAMLLDPDIGVSLIAKAFFYVQDEQYQLAINYFEKVLAYSPNTLWVHNSLSDIYSTKLPDSKKYLKHALKGIKTLLVQQDSAATSFSYLHLSNALVQSGFIKEAEFYIHKSLDFYPDNLYSQYLKVYILLASHQNLDRAKQELLSTLEKDSSRIDILQEVAKVCYTNQAFEDAWHYYQRMLQRQNTMGFEVFQSEDIKIAYTLMQLEEKDSAQHYLEKYKNFAQNDQSIYRDLSWASYYATIGDFEKGMEHFKAFTAQGKFLYWFILFFDKDPIIQELSAHAEFRPTLEDMKAQFWQEHNEVKIMLEKDGLEIK